MNKIVQWKISHAIIHPGNVTMALLVLTSSKSVTKNLIVKIEAMKVFVVKIFFVRHLTIIAQIIVKILQTVIGVIVRPACTWMKQQTAAFINLISVSKIILVNNGELVPNYAKVAIGKRHAILKKKTIVALKKIPWNWFRYFYLALIVGQKIVKWNESPFHGPFSNFLCA